MFSEFLMYESVRFEHDHSVTLEWNEKKVWWKQYRSPLECAQIFQRLDHDLAAEWIRFTCNPNQHDAVDHKLIHCDIDERKS
jgi:hypothetical protein